MSSSIAITSAPSIKVEMMLPQPLRQPWGMFKASDINHQDRPPFLPQLYDVEDLLETDRIHGKRLFLVKWKNYTSKHNTWELASTVNHVHGYKTFLKELGVRRSEDLLYFAARKEDDPILEILKEKPYYKHVYYKVEWDIFGKKDSWVHHSVVQGTPVYNQWQYEHGRISKEVYDKAYFDYHGIIEIERPEEED
ncbi:hypothetical protein BJ165DRAFT_1535187 [Panaeolus papilionaceus]|nr:hypothetical protein BJ165DRAFT_1535187 [Panaeolus papilionaceus]